MINSAHIHLVLNHVPVIGTPLALLILIVALVRRNDDMKKLALWLLALLAVLSIPAYLTGEPAEKTVNGLPGVIGSVIERHEEAGQLALILISAAGVFAVGALAVWRKKPVPRWFAVSLLTLGFAAAGSLAWTANLGGKVRHTEIRSDSNPSLNLGDRE